MDENNAVESSGMAGRRTPTPEERERGTIARSKAVKLRRSLGVPNAMRAIRLKCIDCSGGSEPDVRNCVIGRCELFPFRMGRNPKPEDLKVAQFSNRGKLTGYEPWEGYRK